MVYMLLPAMRAKVTMAVSLVLLALTVFTWWWAPTESASTALIRVSVDGQSICGELLSADGEQFRVLVDGETKPRAIPFDTVENVRLISAC